MMLKKVKNRIITIMIIAIFKINILIAIYCYLDNLLSNE